MMRSLQPLLSVALDLTRSVAATDRYRRVVQAAMQIVPCDAVCLLRMQEGVLQPLAAVGLVPEALARVYRPEEHPRLDAICRSDRAVRFPADTELPDPFDGMLEADRDALTHVHACLGAPLRVDGELVGCLTADALAPDAYDALDPEPLSWLAALAGAAVRTSQLIEAMEETAARLGLVTQDLIRSAERTESEIIGASMVMRALRREIAVVARSELAVLITGETGVGKELVARAIHAASDRRDMPLIHVNCAALPETTAESELFGHVRGAFTGAEDKRAGKFEIADGGTLLLDEIGELPLSVQPKLLRALQQGELQRVGSDRALRVDVRVIAATNRDLEVEVAAGRFRADLFHRLAVYPIRVPPLRKRAGDVRLLAARFIEQVRVRLGLGTVRLTAEARQILEEQTWPGNVRELENAIYRAVLRVSQEVERGQAARVEPRHLGMDYAGPEQSGPIPVQLPAPAGADGAATNAVGADANADGAATPSGLDTADARPLREQVDDFQRRAIQRAVDTCDGNWSAAARALGIHRSNLHHLARRLGLKS